MGKRLLKEWKDYSPLRHVIPSGLMAIGFALLTMHALAMGVIVGGMGLAFIALDIAFRDMNRRMIPVKRDEHHRNS